jgi:hypothetical protein
MSQIVVIVPGVSGLCLGTKDFGASHYGHSLTAKIQKELDAFLALDNSLNTNAWAIDIFGLQTSGESRRHIQVNLEVEGFAPEDYDAFGVFGQKVGAIVRDEFSATPLRYTRITVTYYKVCGAYSFPIPA